MRRRLGAHGLRYPKGHRSTLGCPFRATHTRDHPFAPSREIVRTLGRSSRTGCQRARRSRSSLPPCRATVTVETATVVATLCIFFLEKVFGNEKSQLSFLKIKFRLFLLSDSRCAEVTRTWPAAAVIPAPIAYI